MASVCKTLFTFQSDDIYTKIQFDVWRLKNPDVKLYTWSNKDCTSLACMEYWSVSDCLDRNNISSNIINRGVVSFSWFLKHDLVIKKIQTLKQFFWNKAFIYKCFFRNCELQILRISNLQAKVGQAFTEWERQTALLNEQLLTELESCKHELLKY